MSQNESKPYVLGFLRGQSDQGLSFLRWLISTAKSIKMCFKSFMEHVQSALMLSLVGLSTFLLLKFYHLFAIKYDLLDHPNERSSHEKPTPLGAGVVFLFGLIAAVVFFYFKGWLSLTNSLLFVFGSLLCTGLGFLDDIKNLTAYKRLIPQFFVSILILITLTSFLKTPFVVKFLPVSSPYLAFVFGVLFIMWMVNLFNFMDGIDGFLGTQVLLMGFFLSVLSYLQGSVPFTVKCLMVPAIALPFLYFNWRPAKLFMGDAGAYFFGFVFAFLGLIGKIEYGLSLVAPCILMGALVCDATLTLFFRLIYTRRIFQGHQTHGFQILRHRFKWRTSRVVFVYAAVTCFWFFPWALMAIKNPDASVFYCFLAYSPVLLVLFFIGVGRD